MPALGVSILIVEDQLSVQTLYQEALTAVGYTVRTVCDAVEAVEWLDVEAFDLALIDLVLPGPDGLMLAAQLRQRQPNCALVLISAIATREHLISALRVGVDDFLDKPISVEKLRQAVGDAILKRRSQHKPVEFGKLTIGALTMDLDQHVGYWQGQLLALTPTEYCLLLTMAQRAGRPIPSAELIQRCRGMSVSEEEARLLLKPHIANLRRKLQQNEQTLPVVMNYRGLGFMLNVGNARAAIR